MQQLFVHLTNYLRHHQCHSFWTSEVELELAFLGRNETRNSSGDEIANVNFLYDDIVHALKIQ